MQHRLPTPVGSPPVSESCSAEASPPKNIQALTRDHAQEDASSASAFYNIHFGLSGEVHFMVKIQAFLELIWPYSF